MENQNRAIWVWVVDQDYPRADIAIYQAMERNLGNPSDLNLTFTRSQVKRWIEEKRATVDSVEIKPSTKLKLGSQVEVILPIPQPTTLIPENRPLDIIFEDEHLLVLNKGPGITVHPSPTQMQGTLVHSLLHHIKSLSQLGGHLRPGIVHRIDKNTSGLLVVTKTDAAHLQFTKIFAKHAIERQYWALCYGSPTQSQMTIESLIGRHPTDRKKMAMNVKPGKKAITHLRKIMEFQVPLKKPFASWLSLTLETGRTHQIRVHLTGSGFSILGDPTYGLPSQNHSKWLALPQSIKTAVQALPGQALHARTLGFEHPITGEKLYFEAEPPPAFQQLLDALQLYSK